MIVRSLSVVLLALLLALSAVAQRPPFCQEGSECQELGRDVALENVRAIAIQPIFQAPMLEADLTGARDNARIVLPDWNDAIYSLSGEQSQSCELLIAGFADPAAQDAFTRYIDLGVVRSIKLYAFCQVVNLPTLRQPGLQPPSQSSPALSSDLKQLPLDQRQRLARVWEQAEAGACPDSANKPIGMDNFITQIAVFIAAQSDDRPPSDTILRYSLESQNPLLRTEYHAIHCLLGETEPPLMAQLNLSLDPRTGFAPASLSLEDASQGASFARRLTIKRDGSAIYEADALPVDELLLTEAGTYEVIWRLEGAPFAYEQAEDGSRRSIGREAAIFEETFSLSSLNPSPTPVPDLDRPVPIGYVSLTLPAWMLAAGIYLVFAITGWAFMSNARTRIIWFLLNTLLITLLALFNGTNL